MNNKVQILAAWITVLSFVVGVGYVIVKRA